MLSPTHQEGVYGNGVRSGGLARFFSAFRKSTLSRFLSNLLDIFAAFPSVEENGKSDKAG
jgi:hypothetical protein